MQNPRGDYRRRGRAASVCGVPDDRVAIIVGARHATEVGVKPPGSELRRSEAERHIVTARTFGVAVPPGADLNLARADAIVRLVVVAAGWCSRRS